MLKKTVTYRDYDSNERTETLWFNMNRFELTEFAAELPDDLFKSLSGAINMETVSRIANEMGSKGVIDFIKNLVLKSYGEKSDDGRRFKKSPELSEEFSQTIAFDTFMSELLSDDNAAANFVNSIIPADMAEKLSEVKSGIGELPQK